MTESQESPSASTGELLRLALAGDDEAERAVFEPHRTFLLDQVRKHRLSRFLRRAGHAADDVVSEVWVRCLASRLLRNFEDRGAGSLRRCLVVVLDRTLMDFARRAGSARRGRGNTPVPFGAIGADGVSPTDLGLPSPDTSPTSRARFAEVEALCKTHLREREWLVWCLSQREGLTSANIATRVALSESSVREILGHVKRKLVRVLASELGREV